MMKTIMNRKNELEIIIASLRSKIELTYDKSRHLATKEFIPLYPGIKTLQDQLDTYVKELESLN